MTYQLREKRKKERKSQVYTEREYKEMRKRAKELQSDNLNKNSKKEKFK